jgi:hypothetical protein
VGQVARALATEPSEAVERVREKFAERGDKGADWDPYEPSVDAEAQLHSFVGAPWPCSAYAAFPDFWSHLIKRLAAMGLQAGRGRYGGWDDGDAALVRAAWCLAHHLRPQVAVETGVARGFTTAAILRALAENDSGHLFSIDLPPLAERRLGSQTGAATLDEDTSRWTLLSGSSRKVLPRLLRDLDCVELFIHDSMHTTRNVTFELEQIWPALANGGAMLVDDLHRNAAFRLFVRAHPESHSVVLRADDNRAVIGCVIKT